jgi:hypothetical protein
MTTAMEASAMATQMARKSQSSDVRRRASGVRRLGFIAEIVACCGKSQRPDA